MPYREPETVELSASGLVAVGVQRGYDDRRGDRNNPDAERHVAELLEGYRAAGLPVVHVRHETVEAGSPFHPNRPGVAFKPAAAPADDEPVVTESALGFDPYVVDDATVAFDREFDGTRYVAEQTHRVALAQLSGAVATVVEAATLLAALERRT
ncbi:cysteine hydrolase [Halobacteriales archaeon QS_9_70_65]|nr:MAG: cysteine hydrolase [Halobacteriales archaeon QS_9_70_65]